MEIGGRTGAVVVTGNYQEEKEGIVIGAHRLGEDIPIIDLSIRSVFSQLATSYRVYHLQVYSFGDLLPKACISMVASDARLLVSVSLSLLISWLGMHRRSLSHSGGIAAILVGVVLTAASGCFCLALLAFFFTSSKLTKWRASEKKKLEHDYKEGKPVPCAQESDLQARYTFCFGGGAQLVCTV